MSKNARLSGVDGEECVRSGVTEDRERRGPVTDHGELYMGQTSTPRLHLSGHEVPVKGE